MDPESIPLTSLYEVLQVLPDRRRSQGICDLLAFMLSYEVLAKLAEEKAMSRATEWVCHRGAFLL
jgi:hypothetical protein